MKIEYSIILMICFGYVLNLSAQNITPFIDDNKRVEFSLLGEIENNFFTYDPEVSLELNTIIVKGENGDINSMIVYGFIEELNEEELLNKFIYQNEEGDKTEIIDSKYDYNFANFKGNLFLYKYDGLKRDFIGAFVTTIRNENVIFYLQYMVPPEYFESIYYEGLTTILNSLKF